MRDDSIREKPGRWRDGVHSTASQLKAFPNLGDGDPDHLTRILQSIGQLEPQVLVPGHGPVGTPDDLELMIAYVHTVTELAQSLVQDGEPEDRLGEVPVPEPFADWELPDFFTANLQYLYRRQR